LIAVWNPDFWNPGFWNHVFYQRILLQALIAVWNPDFWNRTPIHVFVKDAFSNGTCHHPIVNQTVWDFRVF
jgi:hypothetical protein